MGWGHTHTGESAFGPADTYSVTSRKFMEGSHPWKERLLTLVAAELRPRVFTLSSRLPSHPSALAVNRPDVDVTRS